MKSYSIIHAILILVFGISISLEVSTDWSDQFIEITSDSAITLSPMQTGIAVIEISTLDDYHIMADQGSDDNFKFTRLEIARTIEGITIGSAQFPNSEKLYLGGTDYSMPVFSGNFEIQIPVEASAKTRSGKYSIPIIMHYQPCDKQKCYYPREVEFIITVEVT